MESENNYWLKCVDTDRKGRGNDNVEVEKGSQESDLRALNISDAMF